MNSKLTRLITIIIILSGIAVRLFHYFYNRSLWMDEVYLTSSFLHFDYSQFATDTLDYNQKAPLGFVWLVKFVIDLLGTSEFTLRAVPLAAGICSILIFPAITKYFLSPIGQLIALFIISLAPAFIYHSVEIKQYSMECLATVIALYLYVKYRNDHRRNSNILWGVFGSLLLWFSYSVVFVLVGIAAAISIDCVLRRKWDLLVRFLLPFSTWMISFIIIHLCLTLKNSNSDWIVYFFKVYNNFMPFPPKTVEEFKWFSKNFVQMMDYPLGLAFPLIPALLLLAGILELRTDKEKLLILALPILLTLGASGLYLYPLVERFWLFLAPILLLIIGFGFESVSTYLKSFMVRLSILAILLLSPMIQCMYYLYLPEKFYKHKKSFERESLSLINRNFRPEDCVYNYWNNKPGYNVYKELYRLRYRAIVGLDMRKQSKNLADYNQKLAKEFNKFRGKKRVWVIYNNQFLTDIGDLIDDPRWYYMNKLGPNENLVKQLEKIGKPIKRFVLSDVTVLLVELNLE